MADNHPDSEIEMQDVYPLNEKKGHYNISFQDPGLESEKPSNNNNSRDNEYVRPDHPGVDEGGVKVPPTDDDAPVHDKLEFSTPNPFVQNIMKIQNAMETFANKNKATLKMIIGLLLLVLYIVYFIYAMVYSKLKSEADIRLLWMTMFVVICVVLGYVFDLKPVKDVCKNIGEKLSPHEEYISWVCAALLYLAVACYLIADVVYITKKPYNLVSLLGLVVFILLMFLFSHHPGRVRWRIVVWGIGLQFVFALLILRTKFGYETFKWLGDRVSEFLKFTDSGSKFVFGDLYMNHYFAFKVLPVIIFFSTITSMLYYLGVMQLVIQKVAIVMEVVMATTAGESLNAAGNIFLGQTEAPLLIKPLIKDMTESELHSIMTTGFATIAGAVLATYILFGVPASHLISASVMSAPAALAISKLFYPETCVSRTTSREVKCMKDVNPYRNIIEAASCGASYSVKLIANIAVNLIAFLALLNFLDACLMWFGARVGIDDLSFELCASYVFYPIAFIMGVESQDCRQIASLIGVKTFLNEFVAYDKLGKIIKNSNDYYNLVGMNNMTIANTTMDGFDMIVNFSGAISPIRYVNGILSKRSEIIATYALCGFANFGSIGVMISGLKAMAPNQRKPLAKVVMRAMIAGNVACFMTACIAGLFFQDN